MGSVIAQGAVIAAVAAGLVGVIVGALGALVARRRTVAGQLLPGDSIEITVRTPKGTERRLFVVESDARLSGAEYSDFLRQVASQPERNRAVTLDVGNTSIDVREATPLSDPTLSAIKYEAEVIAALGRIVPDGTRMIRGLDVDALLEFGERRLAVEVKLDGNSGAVTQAVAKAIKLGCDAALVVSRRPVAAQALSEGKVAKLPVRVCQWNSVRDDDTLRETLVSLIGLAAMSS